MPRGDGIGVSARIEDEAERARLKALVTELRAGDGSSGGYIVRTAAQGAAAEAISRGHAVPRPSCGSTCARRRLRAQRRPAASTRTCRCRCACCATSWRAASTACWSTSPRAHARMLRVRRELHAGQRRPASSCTAAQRPIFDLHGVEEEIAQALERKVPLKSGGYLVIDQTEAMTTIDVNTGAFVGHRNLEETDLPHQPRGGAWRSRGSCACATSAASSSSTSST